MNFVVPTYVNTDNDVHHDDNEEVGRPLLQTTEHHHKTLQPPVEGSSSATYNAAFQQPNDGNCNNEVAETHIQLPSKKRAQ